MNLYKAAYPFVQGLEFAAVQIIAVDTVEKKRFAHSRLPDKSRSSHPQYCIDRRFEPSPGVERAAALRLLLVLFVEAKRIKPFPFGNFPLHGKQAHVGAARCACYKDSRFCKPRSRSHRWRYHKGRFAAFHLLLKK